MKFNKFFKQLAYDVSISGHVKLTPYFDELLNFEQWSNDVIEYITSNPDPILIEKTSVLGSPVILEDYLLEGQDVLAQNIYDAVTKVVKAVNELNSTIYNLNRKAKGKYADLVNEFANEQAAELFDCAVCAGFLTRDYQPKGDTDMFTLKILAFAIGENLRLALRHRWAPFEEQWAINSNEQKLATIPIRLSQFNRAEKLMSLYPEVDFTALRKPKDDMFFKPVFGSKRVRKMYNDLCNHGYIHEGTTVDQFLGIFNLGTCSAWKPIEWKGDQRQLSYFVQLSLAPSNKNFWTIAQSCFTINGNPPNKESMKSGVVALKLNGKYDRYDLELKRIASEYNNG